MHLASAHGRHHAISCRDPFLCVLPKQEAPRPYVRIQGEGKHLSLIHL